MAKGPTKRAAAFRWNEFCQEQYRKATDTMIRAGTHQVTGEWDWLGFAIEKLGGVKQAAAKLGCSRQVLYKWLEDGLRNAPFAMIVRVSETADVPLVYLARRLGPYETEAEKSA